MHAQTVDTRPYFFASRAFQRQKRGTQDEARADPLPDLMYCEERRGRDSETPEKREREQDRKWKITLSCSNCMMH